MRICSGRFGAGTGHFGVVTSLVFRPIPAPTVATTFHLEWPFADAVSVAEAWMVWSPSAPEALAASMVVSASAEREEAPTVEVFGTMLGAVSEARHQLEASPRLGSDPSSTFVEEMGYEDTMRYWAARAGERLEEPRATPMTRSIHAIKSEYFARPLPTEAIAALLGGLTADRSGGQARELDFSPWGGAYNRIEAEATAFAHRDAAFWVKHGAVVPTDATANQQMAARDWVGASWAFLPSLGDWRLPELRGRGPRGLGARVLRLELRAAGRAQARTTRQPVPFPPFAPGVMRRS